MANQIPDGNFHDLFDPNRNIFPQAAVAPFGSITDARTAFAAIWTTQHQNDVVLDLQGRLSAEVTPAVAAINLFSQIDLRQVCGEVFSFLDSAPIQEFCLRFLMTPAWGPGTLTYSDLLVHVFVQLEYLGHALDWRSQQDSLPILSQKTHWPKTRHAVVNGLASFLPMLLADGPSQDMTSFCRHVDQIQADNCPVYAMFAYPIQRLVQGFFPWNFRYREYAGSAVNNFVKNQKSKITDAGVYSQSYLQGCIDNQFQGRDYDFAKRSGKMIYYPVLRVLSLDCYQYSTNKADPMQIHKRKNKTRDQHVCISDAEERAYRNYDPIVVEPAWLVNGPRRFRASRLWEHPGPTTRARRRMV
jgi:hypothetical protein